MSSSTLQLWSLASRIQALIWHSGTAQGHTHTADLAVPGLLQNKRRLLQQQQEQHVLQLACELLQIW